MSIVTLRALKDREYATAELLEARDSCAERGRNKNCSSETLANISRILRLNGSKRCTKICDLLEADYDIKVSRQRVHQILHGNPRFFVQGEHLEWSLKDG